MRLATFSAVTHLKSSKIISLSLFSDGGRSVGLEVSSESLFARSGDGLDNGELDGSISVYAAGGSSKIIRLSNNSGSKDMDGVVSSSVLTTHFHEELGDSTVEGDVSEFLVHIVDSSSGLVSEGNGVRLDGSLVLFVDLTDANDLTLSFLELVESSSLEPELGSSNDWVGGEDSDRDNFTFRDLFSGDSSASHQVLVDIHLEGGVGFHHCA